MKRSFALLACLALVGVLVLPLAPATAATQAAAGTAGSWNGWITDDACGAKRHDAAHASCATKCFEKGAKAVFYNNADQKLYQLDKQDAAKKETGHEVTVKGTVNGDSITVDSIAPAAKTK
jgi:hypothetical protein